LLDYASGLQRARATAEVMTSTAQRYLAHRAKANERDRRYRECKRERERRLKLPKPDTPLSLTSLLCSRTASRSPPQPERLLS